MTDEQHAYDRCTCRHARQRHAYAGRCDYVEREPAREAPWLLPPLVYRPIVPGTECPCQAFKARPPAWRVRQSVRLVDMWLTAPLSIWEVVDPAGRAIACVSDQPTASRIAQALADAEALSNDRRIAARNSAHPAARAAARLAESQYEHLAAQLDVNEAQRRLNNTQRRLHVVPTPSTVAMDRLQHEHAERVARADAGSLQQPVMRSLLDLVDGVLDVGRSLVGDDRDTLADKADHYRER